MLEIVLVRPGATDFDEQGRIKGCLDMPMSANGHQQVDRLAGELSGYSLETIYCGPCESARQTATRLAQGRRAKMKTIDCLKNVDHGLWHGKLIAEVRRQLPRVYRQGQDSPQCLCPPRGETLEEAADRIKTAIAKILRKHRHGSIAIVVPEPLASIVAVLLSGGTIQDLWKVETDTGSYEVYQAVESQNDAWDARLTLRPKVCLTPNF